MSFSVCACCVLVCLILSIFIHTQIHICTMIMNTWDLKLYVPHLFETIDSIHTNFKTYHSLPCSYNQRLKAISISGQVSQSNKCSNKHGLFSKLQARWKEEHLWEINVFSDDLRDHNLANTTIFTCIKSKRMLDCFSRAVPPFSPLSISTFNA